MKLIEIKRPVETDIEEINSLIIDVFMKCVAPEYSKEGIDFFLSICKIEEIKEIIKKRTPIFVAKYDSKIYGVLWTRDNNHISRYFVDVANQKKGIGRNLFHYLLKEIKTNHTEFSDITVNSSPFAFTAYEKIGFTKTMDEQIANGMRYIPMIYKIK